MRLPRISALLLTATCCLSGCCSFNGMISTDDTWATQKGGVVQKGALQKGGVIQKGHGHPKGIAQKGHAQKGGSYKSVMHQNLWNQYEPSACCGGWDPILGSCDACGVCGGACEGHTPAQHLKHMLTCASGCGEIYWGEWISDPPDDCDPCDDWGNWVGPTDCCGTSCLDSLASSWCNLFGYRNGGGKGGKGKGGCGTCGGKGGCDSCDAGGLSAPYYDVPVEDSGEAAEAPTPEAPTPEIEAGNQPVLRPRSTPRFSLRSTRLTR